MNSGIVIFFTLFPRYRSLSKPNKRLGYSVECGLGVYTKLVQGKCKHASLAALTNPQRFLSPFIFLFGREEAALNLSLCLCSHNLEDRRGCLYLVLTCVWWRGLKMQFGETAEPCSWCQEGQSCCLFFASSSVLPLSSQQC